MADIRMVKTIGHKWIPATPADQKLTDAWKVGDIVKFKAQKPRNGDHHRLMFALLSLVKDNLPEKYEEQFPSTEALLTELKFQVGHCEEHRTLGGKTTYLPKSIAFDAMDQAAFRVFYDDVIEVVIKYFLPTLTSDEIKNEIIEATSGGSWNG
jgi:hypothetical protein